MTSRSDINFSGDETHRFLPSLVGIMSGLAALLLCLGLTISSWVIDRGSSYGNSFTVNIPADSDDLKAKSDEIQKVLQSLPGVREVARLGPEKLKDMLKPWLGSIETLGDLPLPVVFDVTMQEKAELDYAALQKTLSAIAPGIEVDAHERWVAAFSSFSVAVQWLLALLATLIIGALGIMIAFTARASLKLHARSVHLLHSIGAEDAYIARQFQREAFKLVLPGALAGCVAAGLAYWAIGIYVASLQASVMPSLALGYGHIALLLLMPPVCGALAWYATRISVRQQLASVL